MSIRKTESGWLVDIQPAGRGGKRYRKTFKTKIDAQRWENSVKVKAVENPLFVIPRKDTRKLSDLVKLWFDLHGINLKAAADTYRRLMAIADTLGDPPAYRFTGQMFADYRAKRIGQGVKPNTLNRERSYLAAVFGELHRLGHWPQDNPMARVRPVRIDQHELTFLTDEQIRKLLAAMQQSKNPDVLIVSKLSLATGARWSEAQNLKREHVIVDPGLVTFTSTKGRKNRSVPIEDQLAKEIQERLNLGRFNPCYGAFREAVDRAGLDLPEGQLAHVLRHTFASHFVMKGGDILTLQRILGHHSVTVTMRYAHLAPEYLEQAKKLNPLTALTLG